MTVVTLPGTVDGSPLSTTFTVASADASRVPGDPGIGRTLVGQTMDATLGVDYVQVRAAQYASDLGMSAGSKVQPKAHHGYIQPVHDDQALAAVAAEFVDIDKVQAQGIYSLTDIKETQYEDNNGVWHNHTFDDVANGSSDAMFDAFIAGITKRKKPAGAFFHNEPVGDGLGGYTECAGAVDRLKSRILLAGADDLITWGCFLGRGSFAGFGGSNPDPDKWIGALAPVSRALGTNGYLQAIDTDPASAWNKTVAQLYKPFWDLQNSVLDSLGLPRMVRFQGEWGVHTRASDLTFAPAFMESFLDLSIAYDVIASFFFDSHVSSPKQSWLLDFNGETSRRGEMARMLVDRRVGYAA